jgi:hypothetical protein
LPSSTDAIGAVPRFAVVVAQIRDASSKTSTVHAPGPATTTCSVSRVHVSSGSVGATLTNWLSYLTQSSPVRFWR